MTLGVSYISSKFCFRSHRWCYLVSFTLLLVLVDFMLAIIYLIICLIWLCGNNSFIRTKISMLSLCKDVCRLWMCLSDSLSLRRVSNKLSWKLEIPISKYLTYVQYFVETVFPSLLAFKKISSFICRLGSGEKYARRMLCTNRRLRDVSLLKFRVGSAWWQFIRVNSYVRLQYKLYNMQGTNKQPRQTLTY